MGTLSAANQWLAGFFALAAIHYAVQWWFSRRERVFLAFSIYCAIQSAFALVHASLSKTTAIPDAQLALDGMVTIGLLGHVAVLQVYAYLSDRRDRAFRAVVAVTLVALVVLNQWVPVRGTVISLLPMQLPNGEMAWLPIRTPPSALLPIMYVATISVIGYGLVVARTLRQRDRTGALLVTVGTAAMFIATAIGLLVDFAHVRAPYVGASLVALFVVFMGIFLSREYSARGLRVADTERRFEAAFEHSPIGKALIAPDGRLLRVNGALAVLLGSTAEEICSRRLRELVDDEEDGSIARQTGRLLAGEIRKYTAEKSVVRSDGERRWALLSLSVIPDDRGQPVHLIAQIQDVTEVRASREKLEELVATRTRELSEAKDEAVRASQAKSEFLAHMSHEIRSPLHAIMLTAQVVEEDPTLSAETRSDIEIIYKSGKHLSALINDVLEMSRIESGRHELLEREFDLGETLDEIAQMFTAQAGANGTELELEPAPDLPRALLCDSGKVKQVVINLVSNAIKFTKDGSIRIRAACSELTSGARLVEIIVADTGIGIAEQDRERLFQPFEQLDAGAMAGGTGLGLAISFAHARLMGGDLSAESALGVGTSFKLTFLAKDVRATTMRDASGRLEAFAATGVRCKVLIVDDIEINRKLLAALLAKSAFETRSADDGSSALSIHAEWSPDVVLMDLRMPGMNGLEAIRRLRAAGSSAAIVALTAGGFGDDERDALDVGADSFLRKPYEERTLLDRVARVLETRGAA